MAVPILKQYPLKGEDLIEWGRKNIKDGVIKLALNNQNKAYATQYIRHLIEKADIRKEGTGKLAIPPGLPKVFFDDVKWSIKGSQRKGDTGVGSFNFRNPKNQEAEALTRAGNLDDQTLAGEPGYNWSGKPEGIHGHHLRMLQLYSPFFKHLKTDAEKKELARFALEELNMPLGDLKANVAELEPAVHSAIHRWMRANGIEVSAKKLPNFEGYDIDQLKEALSLYQEYVQKPVEEQLELIKNKVSLYEPTKEDLDLMSRAGMSWDQTTGQFLTKQKSNLPTEYSNKKPGWGFDLSNLFSIAPNYDHTTPPHLMRNITSEMMRKDQNWLGPIAHGASEYGLNTVTAGRYQTGKTLGQTAVQLGKGDIKGAALTVGSKYVTDNLIREDILPLEEQIKIGPGT